MGRTARIEADRRTVDPGRTDSKYLCARSRRATEGRMNDQPAIVARYEDAKTAAGACGLQLSVAHRIDHVFVLADNGAAVRTFTDIAHVEDFLRGVEQERRSQAARKRRR